jgi:hypothetical protein
MESANDVRGRESSVRSRMSRVRKEPDTAQNRLLHSLVRERGFAEGEYALFFVSGEGRFLPASTPEDPLEEASGCVLDRQGRVFSFWLGWDAEKQQPIFTRWREVALESHWAGNAEYLHALERVGLRDRTSAGAATRRGAGERDINKHRT